MEGDRAGAGHALRSVDQLRRDPRRHPGDRPLHRPVAHRRLRADRSESRARGRRLPRGLRHGLHHRGGDRSARAAIRRREEFSQRRQALGLFPHAPLVGRAFLLIPGLNFLLILGLYGFYLLWVGLPMLMKVPNDKALPYAAIVTACALIPAIVLTMI